MNPLVFHIFGSEWIVVPGVGLASFVITYMNADHIIEWLWRQSLGNREYVVKRLSVMFVEINKRQITGAMLAASFGVGFLFFVLLWPHIILGLAVGAAFTVLGWRLPKLVVDIYYSRRSSQFIDQLVDGLTLMANGMKSGLSITQAMEVVVKNMPNPLAQEFELMLSQNRLGAGVEEIYNDLATRIPYPDVQMFVTAVNTLSSTGGNMAETFGTIAKTIRERIKVEKKIAAITAQGVMQGTIITLVPFVLLVILYFVDPVYIAPLFNTTLGLIMLLAMMTLQIIGGLMIRKIVKIKV